MALGDEGDGGAFEAVASEQVFREALEVLNGDRSQRGLKRAVEMLKVAAKAGHAKAQHVLGTFYLQGQGVRRNRGQAVNWFRESAAQGYPGAMYYLALAHLTGEGARQDQAEAERLFEEILSPRTVSAIAFEDYRMYRALKAESAYFLGTILKGRYDKAPEEALGRRIVGLMSEAVRSDNANATVFMALEYAKGELVERNIATTKAYLEKYHLMLSDSVRRGVEQMFVEQVEQAFVDEFERETEERDRALYEGIYAGISSLCELWLSGGEAGPEVELPVVVSLLEIAAEGGNVFAQTRLALMLAQGQGCAVDEARAYALLSRAAPRDYRVAAYNLGVLLASGRGVEKDEAAAALWWSRSSSIGVYAARAIRDGGLEPRLMDAEELLRLCEERRKKGDLRAECSYLMRQRSGWGVAREGNAKRLFKRFLSLAKKGDALAAAVVGDMYYFGQGVDKDFAKALPWVDKAAASGEPEALFRLGYMYSRGEGVEASEFRAANCYREASAKGHMMATNNLACVYFDSMTDLHDSEKAVTLWLSLASQGGSTAMGNLGLAYQKGMGVQGDVEESIKWYAKAGRMGDLFSVRKLIELYGGKMGVERDEVELAYWEEKAAELGDVDSMYKTAMRFYRGESVPKSKFKAMYWGNAYAAQNARNYNFVRTTNGCKAFLMLADLMATPGWEGSNAKAAIDLYKTVGMAGWARAQYDLANHYREGSFGESLKPRSFDLYKSLAKSERGDRLFRAQVARSLALCYREGLGTRQSDEKWLEWLQIAADLKFALAEYELGLAYAEGRLGKTDESKAFELIKRASDKNLKEAHFWLSAYYLKTDASSDAALRGVEWLQDQARSGNAKAREILRSFQLDWREPGKEESPPAEEEKEDSWFVPTMVS